ncbi:MAG TPA: MBL fold metallo-hydrolase [Verrucomicrobiae bacterium]|jgi:phosphoribosyl 1,2-cyclic phosphodiesterase|nr:MBL fold metallo-hydrolase [Verrucomicrobiae bacterium]
MGDLEIPRETFRKPLLPPGNFSTLKSVSVQFTILGSGSNGNCAYLEYGNTRVLIDAGFSAKQIRERLAQIGRAPESLSGILLTHEHTDHTNGLGTLCSKLAIPIYCNRLTKEAVEIQFKAKFDFRIFSTGASFELGELGIETFSVPHDAYDPVGFLLRADNCRIGFLTDLGHATKMVMERVRPSTVLVLETNHDMKLLQDDLKRPWSVKQRIMSRHGHLCNDAAANVIEELLSAELRHVYLGHLSRDCNKPELAYRTVNERLSKTGATHVTVCSTSQEERCDTLVI